MNRMVLVVPLALGVCVSVIGPTQSGYARTHRVPFAGGGCISTHSARLGANIISNPAAEKGKGSRSWNSVVTVPGWITSGNFTVGTYRNTTGYPDPKGPNHPGKKLFLGGPGAASSVAMQNADTLKIAGPVDSGRVRYSLSGWLRGYGDQKDSATVTAYLLDSTHVGVLATARIGPVSAEDRGYNTWLLLRKKHGKVPRGTRYICTTLTMTWTEGNYVDGYGDNLSLMLTRRK